MRNLTSIALVSLLLSCSSSPAPPPVVKFAALAKTICEPTATWDTCFRRMRRLGDPDSTAHRDLVRLHEAAAVACEEDDYWAPCFRQLQRMAPPAKSDSTHEGSFFEQHGN